jgi:hypothetical protein
MDPSIKDLAYRALASTIGGPVDLTSILMKPFGYGVEKPVLGSEWVGQKMEQAGLVSNSRDPLKEFAASVMVPGPGGLAATVGKGAAMIPALAGMSKLGKVEDVASIASRAKRIEDLQQDTQQLGPVALNVFRSGEINDPFKRGTFFAGDRAGADAYSVFHNNAPAKEYLVDASNVYQTKSHASLYRELFDGSIQDAIYKAERSKDVKTSTEAWRKVEAKMAAELKKRGYDGLIYTSPLAPARTEFAVINPKTAKVISVE